MDKNRKLCRQHSSRFCFVNHQKGGTTKKLKNPCTHSNRSDQNRAPICKALESFRQMRVVLFDVPGNKRGRGNPELTAFLGQQCIGADVNSMKPLNNLCHPVSVILEAEKLAAEAFGVAHALLHHQFCTEHDPGFLQAGG